MKLIIDNIAKYTYEHFCLSTAYVHLVENKQRDMSVFLNEITIYLR
jgi:hypothetical protein